MGSVFFDAVKITCFAHASVLLSFKELNFYIDPYVVAKNSPPADAIFHTHDHFDHLVVPKSILKATTKIISRGGKIPSIEINVGDTIKVFGIDVKAVDAYNVNKPFHPKGFGCGFIFTFPTMPKTTRIYIAGDTDIIEEMKNYSCDVAILPIGGTYTMNCDEAAQAASIINPKLVIPYHYNYLNETKADPKEFERAVKFFSKNIDVKILI
ncbi:MAG: MBL fold metallo-hydrolase [Candidatus Anstonellaceae archaeon]